MQNNFWHDLKKPIFALAPLANVTDVVFREIIAKYGKPDVMFTEFVSADGLISRGREILKRDLEYTENQRPIVAQFFTASPEKMREAAKLAVELGFDGVDVNMGCPDRAVVKQGAGAALIKTPALAKEIIAAAKEGAGSLPVSIKTRIGFNQIEIDSWIPVLLETDLAALSIHLRTMKEMSKVPAHWEVLTEIVKIRQASDVRTLIIGNGDAITLEEGKRRTEETGADGIMFGRGIFGNPFLFSNKDYIKENKNTLSLSKDVNTEISLQQKLAVLLEHTELFRKTWENKGVSSFAKATEDALHSRPSAKGGKNFDIMKKHFKAYVNGFPSASEFRLKLMEEKDQEKIIEMLREKLSEISVNSATAQILT